MQTMSENVRMRECVCVCVWSSTNNGLFKSFELTSIDGCVYLFEMNKKNNMVSGENGITATGTKNAHL